MAYPLYTPDLLAAWQSRFQRERQGEADQANAGQRKIQEQMAAEQLKSLQEENKKAELIRSLLTSTTNRPGTPSDSVYSQGFGNFWNRERDLEDLSMLTGNKMPPRGLGGGGGGRGGGGGGAMSGETEPGSYYTYGQNEARRQGELSQAAADMAGAQAKGAGLKASGYGSATADLMAQKKMEEETANNEANRLAELEKAKLYSTARVDAAEAKGKGANKTADVSAGIETLKQMEEFKGISDNARAAITNDPKVIDMIGKNADPIDILIYLATTYPGANTLNSAGSISVTNSRTGAPVGPPMSGVVSTNEY